MSLKVCTKVMSIIDNTAVIINRLIGCLNSSKNGLKIVKKNPISTEIKNLGSFVMSSLQLSI